MEIIITNHAVEQYRKKMYSKLGDQEIRRTLEVTAERGTFVAKRPGGAHSLKYNGLSIVAEKKNNKLIVITFLGNETYSNWSKNKEIRPRYRKAVC